MRTETQTSICAAAGATSGVSAEDGCRTSIKLSIRNRARAGKNKVHVAKHDSLATRNPRHAAQDKA